MRQSIAGTLKAVFLTGATFVSGAAHTQPGWSDAAPLPSPRQEIYATTYNGTIYTAGGLAEKASAVRNEFSAFDSRANRWLELARLPSPRHHITLSALDGIIYALGGFSGAFPNGNHRARPMPSTSRRASGLRFHHCLSHAVSMSRRL